ncbi:Titin [Dirofilaria immitis]|nr:Titin [Dirofilaria immitis]
MSFKLPIKLSERFFRKPNPDVEWLDTNGRPITTKSNCFEVSTYDRLTTLAITGVDNDTEGKYSLKVSNELGEAKCEIVIKVLGRLNAPNRPFLEKQEFNSVNLKWDEIPEAITKKKEKAKKDRNEEWVTAVETIQPNVTIKELEFDSSYQFRIRAIIAGVTSEPSEESESFFVEYKKLEEKDEVEEQKGKINNDEFFTDVKPSEYCDINILQLPSSLESKVIVMEPTLRMAPKFEVPLQDQTALAGKEVKLKCRILGDPQPQIIWMKDGVMINTNRHKKLEFTEDGWCSLIIFNCTAKDTGFYICTASNVLGSESSQLMLTVAEIAGPDSHLITAENKKHSIVNQDLRVCQVQWLKLPKGLWFIKLISRAIGLPKPFIKWLKDGKEITKTNRAYEISLTGEGESVLSIPYAVTKTAGTFKCVAENSEGSTSFETQCIVHTFLHKQYQEKQAPSFTMDLTDIGVAIGRPVTLKCHIQGIPEPQLKWIFINDAQQISVIRTTIDSAWAEYRQGEICEMKTENVVKTQQGTYQCIAINEHGKAMTQCYLLVGGI